ncbi:Ribonucleoside-triphosphate reductase, anaerobic [Paracholeplasma brassicae]|uniref:Ribonucleoside-triphosphate reductase, anaerobic n=1 Tax=Acholeplasma brassicae TaxID=61635 RepID=U4KSH4_9MOLU|nr:anaerobic ribonucleoside triphosphate reductase [Paracholeplasma brassicae]CCV66653.1 Ribonucleoside-triphosphate reductase, anaerobic [Paracholeplasma brassicae]
MREVLKRDGRTVLFDEAKISQAVLKAMEATNLEEEGLPALVTKKVNERIDVLYKDRLCSVEDIQDEVESVLIELGKDKLSKNYILYRNERNRIRDSKSLLMKQISDITLKDKDEVDEKRENANIDGDTAMGVMLKMGSETAKSFYLQSVIDKRFSSAHKEGLIHIHDLDFYTLTMTCCQIDLIKLFEGGFSTGHGHLREPKDIRSYASLAAIAIQANQNDQHGGQSVPNFDYAMAKGVKKTYKKTLIKNLYHALSLDKNTHKSSVELFVNGLEEKDIEVSLSSNEYVVELLKKYEKNLGVDAKSRIERIITITKEETEEQTLQAMEALVHNLNTMHSRAGAQVPFSSLNYGTDTSVEGRMVIKCLLEATQRGLGDGETPIFPIQIFKVKEGINYEKTDPNYDLFLYAMQVSSKRLFPNFSFLDAPFNIASYDKNDYDTEIAYMGCRTRVMSNRHAEKNTVGGRGNLSFTSINLPRLAIESKSKEAFFVSLKETMDLVKDQLLERFNIQASKKVYNFPFLMKEHIWKDSNKLGINDEVRDVIKHGTLGIGFIGLAETLIALTGDHHGSNQKVQALGLEIIAYMRDLTDQYSETYDLNFSVVATPAEGLSGRFIKLDQKKFGEIKGITDKGFYTNSFHVPVYHEIDVFDKISIEAPYHNLTNGGHISYVEVDGDISKNLEAFEQIIRHMKETGIGYGSINHPIDRDPICGYQGIIDNICPKCGRDETDYPFERIRRITGYLVGTLDRFNDAKKEEVMKRVKHLKHEN